MKSYFSPPSNTKQTLINSSLLLNLICKGLTSIKDLYEMS